MVQYLLTYAGFYIYIKKNPENILYYTNAIWYSFQDGVVETILVEKDDTVKLENIEKVYDTYPPPDKNFKYEDPYVTDEEMRQLALERVIRIRVAT